MTTLLRHLIKTGNATAVVIPPTFLKALRVRRGDLVALRINDSVLELTPVNEKALFNTPEGKLRYKWQKYPEAK